MYTRKLIDFLFSETQHIAPTPNAGIPAEAEFAWPPPAEDMDAFSVVHLHADDRPETAPAAADFSEVA